MPVKKNTENLDMVQFMQSILCTSPQSMFLLDKNKYIIGVYNIKPETIIGHTVDDIVGTHLSVYAKDPSSPFYEACSQLDRSFDSVFATGIPESFEYMIGEVHFESTVNKIMGDKILSQVRNITQIVNNRMEIERKGRNETSVALTAGGLSSWSYDVKSQYFSSSCTNTIIGSGITFDGLLQKIVPEHRHILRTMFDDLLSKRKEHCEITVKVYQNGKILWDNVHAIPHIYSPDGDVEVIIGSHKDITQEYEINNEIKDNRLKLQMAVRSGGMTLWEYNVVEDMLKIYEDDTEESKTVSFTRDFKACIHPDDIISFETEAQALIEGHSQKFDKEIRHWDGDKWNWLLINASIFHFSDNEICIIGLTKNINEEIGHRRELIELRNRAEESSRIKTAFIANMSHEIRTPLNAIIGFSNMVASADNKDEQRAYVQLVAQNNEILLNLINDILDLSDLESGKITFQFSNIHIADLMEQIASGIRLKAHDGVKVTCDPTCGVTEIISDTTRLSQVLTNLMTNAAKFTYTGEITVGCTKCPDGGVRFYVRDTGIGIPKDKLSSVFDRFVKLNTYTQGTGLGLSICQVIVSMLGGNIGVESEEGRGSEFWFTLPKH